MPQKTVVIYDGSDADKLAELQMAVRVAAEHLEDARERAEREPKRYGDTVPETVAEAESVWQAAKDEFDAFVDVACERADEWVIESLGHEAWRDLVEKHQPRTVPNPEGGEQVHAEDVVFGFNTRTLPKELLTFVDPDDDEHRTVARIGDQVPTDLAKRLRRLSAGEFDTLWVTAYQLNVGGVADPKLVRYSTGPRSSGS